MNSYNRMVNFIKTNGGAEKCVRFDNFAREHLMGATGFYSTQVDMRRGPGQVNTPSFNERYVNTVSLILVLKALKHVAKMGANKKKFVFAEIGGGNGNFKRAFISTWEHYGAVQAGESIFPDLEYISVEPNPNHRAAQSFAGKVVKGTAQKTGLPNSSVDLLFDEEVVDCLPFRIVKYDPEKKNIYYEAFVQIEPDNTLNIVFEKAERDEGIAFYEKFLKTRTPYIGDLNWSDDYPKYWAESFRVLKPGGVRVSIDYSVERTAVSNSRYCYALREPYLVDLTHYVDYKLQTIIALQQGFNFVGHVLLSKAISGVSPGIVSSPNREILEVEKPM